MEKVSLKVGRQTNAGTLIRPPHPREKNPGILFAHGWGASEERDIRFGIALAEQGFVCLTFNFRGHGSTENLFARVTREANLWDIRKAYDVLASHREVDPGRIGVVGFSYGAYMAVLLTHDRSVRWLVLRAPALYKDEGFRIPKSQLALRQNLAEYRKTVIPLNKNRALRAACEFKGEVLLVESENDTVIPHQVVRNYTNAFGHARALTYKTILGADHALSEEKWRLEYVAMLGDWFRERGKPE